MLNITKEVLNAPTCERKRKYEIRAGFIIAPLKNEVTRGFLS